MPGDTIFLRSLKGVICMYYGSFKKGSFGGGYSSELADSLLGDAKLILVSELLPRYAWSDEKKGYTDEVLSQVIFVASEDLSAPLEIKLPSEFELPEGVGFLSPIRFDALEACQVRSQIYFRASGLKEDE